MKFPVLWLLQVLDCCSHPVRVPRRPVVALRQPRHPGAASRGNDDRELLGAVAAGTGPGTSMSGRPTAARWRPQAAAPPTRPHARLDAILFGCRRPLSRSPRPVRSDTTSSAPDRTPGRRASRTPASSAPWPAATRARWPVAGRGGIAASGGVIDLLLRRHAEREHRPALEIAHREVAHTDDVHADQYVVDFG